MPKTFKQAKPTAKKYYRYDGSTQQSYDQQRGTRQERGYGAEWQRLRRFVLSNEPLCRHCKTTPANEVDHIKPLSQGGGYELDNLQPLCKPCHSKKTFRDKKYIHQYQNDIKRIY